MTLRKISFLLLLLGFVCLSGQAFGQAARFDSVAQTTTTVSATNTTVLVPLSDALITVCNYPSNGTLPCTNKANVCPDVTLVGCTSSAPNNPITADSLGNFGFWAMGGSYDYTVCAVSGVCQGPYHAVLGQPNGTNSAYTVDGISYATIQAAINAAGTTGYVIIPSSYAGVDTYTNTNGIQINDRRRTPANAPSRYRGFINMLTDCGLKGDGVTDDATAANACFAAYPGYEFYFPKTQANGTCNYLFGTTLNPQGAGTVIRGAGGGSYAINSGSHFGGTELCFTPGVTGFLLDNVNHTITLEDISINGQSGTGQQASPTSLNLPSASNMPIFARNISAIQRAANVLTVTVTSSNVEGLTAQTGSTLTIAGVVGDTTMNGNCVVATLTTTATNPTTFTCAQNGADAGPFGAVGTVSPATTGSITADGIRVCGNFHAIRHVSVGNFGRYGINAASNETGCVSPFSDDLVVRDSIIFGNQAAGIFLRGSDSNAGHFTGNALYYNGIWGAYDASFLGNTWEVNQASYNALGAASATTPATKAISTISRTLTSGISQVSVVLSVADTNLKLGSCVVIAGVTDATFNTPATQCFFINSFTNSTHFGYEQPGAPANASSSGGTSRMAKFTEAYLSSGLDYGSFKIGTSSATWSQSFISNYSEGGQACKFGITVPVLYGTTVPIGCAPTGGDWLGVYNQLVPGLSNFGTNISNISNSKNTGKTLQLQAGISTGTAQDFYLQYKDHTATDTWGVQVINLTAGAAGNYIIRRGNAAGGTIRMNFNGPSTAGGKTTIDAESTGSIDLNKTSGTGGTCFGNGAAACVATVDSTGLGIFVGVKTSGAISPTVAGAQTAGTNPLPFSSVFVGAAATNNAQLTGTFTGARVQTLPDVTGTVSMIDAKLCGTTSTCANTTQTLPRIIFGSVALASATPSAVTVSGISPAFTSTSSYFCTATPVGATAAIAAGGIAVTNVSSSSFTLTGPNTVTTVINYTCVGN